MIEITNEIEYLRDLVRRNTHKQKRKQNAMSDNCDCEDYLREGEFHPDSLVQSHLFIIQQMGSSEPLFWNCSAEHGCGWHPGYPKQAFSKSELCKQLASMIEHGHFSTIIIRELSFKS